MPVVIITRPEFATPDVYDAVNAKVFGAGGPPDGLLVHTAGTTDDGTFQVVDVWESREAYERFGDERLRPAIREVAQERGMEEPSGPPNNTAYEAHNVQIVGGATQ